MALPDFHYLDQPIPSTYVVSWDEGEEYFDTLLQAYSYADTIDLSDGGTFAQYEGIQIFRCDANPSTFEFRPDGSMSEWLTKPPVHVITVHDTNASVRAFKAYNSPEAVAARQAKADAAALARELRLARRPIKVNKPAYQERYDLQPDGSMRLKPHLVPC